MNNPALFPRRVYDEHALNALKQLQECRQNPLPEEFQMIQTLAFVGGALWMRESFTETVKGNYIGFSLGLGLVIASAVPTIYQNIKMKCLEKTVRKAGLDPK